MALVTVNQQDSIETRITMPRVGAWHIDALVDNPAALAGVATVDVNDGALLLAGTVMRSGIFADTGHVRIVAGAGGMGLSARPRHYNGTSVRIVLGDLLAAGGEKLSPTADQSVLSIGLDAWTTGAAPIGALVSMLLAAAAPGAIWRSLPDGTVWVGFDMWRDAVVDVNAYQIFADGAEGNSMRIGVDAPLQLVGTVFESRQVSATEAVVGQVGDGVEMTVWFEDGAPGPEDRLRKSFASLVRKAAARPDRVDYGRMYPATIVSQSGGTVDVQPDLIGGRALLADMAGVPLWLGLPGASVDGTIGGRVLVGWQGGDPARPFAAPFDAFNIPKLLTLLVAAAGGFLSLGQTGAPPAVVGAHQAAEATMVGQLIGAFSTLAAACASPPLSALSAGFAAVGTALTAYQTAAAGANNFLSTKVGISP
jgi:hypothetical protein